jgi:hypothetical protein
MHRDRRPSRPGRDPPLPFGNRAPLAQAWRTRSGSGHGHEERTSGWQRGCRPRASGAPGRLAHAGRDRKDIDQPGKGRDEHSGRLPASAARRGLGPAASSPVLHQGQYAGYPPLSRGGDTPPTPPPARSAPAGSAGRDRGQRRKPLRGGSRKGSARQRRHAREAARRKGAWSAFTVSYWSPERTDVMRCVLKPSQCIRPA